MTAVTADMIERKRQAAEAGDVESCVFMGHLYAGDGHGVARDYNKSFYYFNRAAELGSGAGAYWLHGLYRFGEGVSEDPEQALFYLETAAARKYPLACRDLAKHYLHSHDADSHRRALENAREYTAFALAGHDVIDADCGMVLCYPVMIALGLGADRDAKKAYELIYQLAERGFSEAVATLAARQLQATELKMTLMLSNYVFDAALPDVMAQGPAYVTPEQQDIDKVDRDLETKLYKAAVTGNADEIDRLLLAGASIEKVSGLLHLSPLAGAAGAGRLAAVEKLVNRGAQVNAVCGPLALTALSQAALHRRLDVAAYLLARGADVHQRDRSNETGRTALDYAREKKDEAMIALLMQHGAG